MASIVLSSVGASVGNAVLPGLGGRLLGSLAGRAGQQLDESWGLTADSSKDSSRLESFKVQDSSYGVSIPVIFGRARVAGNVIWVSDLIETAHEESSSSGGKGGAFSSSSTTYTYSLNCAVALCAGEIGSVQTIWADSKIIYENGVWTSGVISSATLYVGADDQAVDPLLEGWIGAGLVPAYRGLAYIVIEGLQLSNFSNRLPNLTFEILPKDPTGKPEWLGTDDPNMYHEIVSTRNQAMLPITIEGGSLSARTMIVGGYTRSSGLARFVVVEYDVTGDAPLEITRTQSGTFSGEDVGDHSWALAADGRFVAMGLQDGASGNPYVVLIYDSQTRQFGSPISVAMPFSEARRVVWIDAQRFVVMGCQDGRRGVHVFLRAGLSVIQIGFYDVWGAGTQVSRVPEMHAQFIPYAGGLLHFVVDEAPDFNFIEARHLVWQNNALSVGDKFYLASSLDTGAGNGGQAYLFRSGDQEWTLLYMTTIDMRMMSFLPGKNSVTITRPWQILDNASMSVVLCHAPVLIGDRIVVVQRSSVENFYRLSEIKLLDSSFSLVVDGLQLEGLGQVGINFSAVSIDSIRLLLSVNWGTLGDLGRVDIIKRRNTGDTLDNVVASILERAGYTSGDYDVTGLANIPVDGYVLAEQATCASALEPLRILEPFDLVESDGQLKAIRRGYGEEAFLSESDFVEAEKQAPLAETRLRETSLPVEVNVDYEDATRDYETGSQKAKRSASNGSRNIAKVVLPMVLSPSRAKQVAENQLFTAWGERTQYQFFLSNTWLGLTPGDIVSWDGSRVRVTCLRLSESILRVEALSCPDLPLSSVAFAEGGRGGSSFTDVLATELYLMDMPLLRAEDDVPGLYAAVTGLDGWLGASLWRASDGVNFSQQIAFTKAAIAGSVVTVLADRSPYYRDRESVLQIQLARGELSSCSEEDLLNGANAALVGAEIIQFQTATLLGPGLYELANLLRGRKGTEEQTSAHAVGEAFVLLSSATMQFVPLQLTDRDVTYNYRAVSNGQSVDVAQDLAMRCQLKTLEPFAPAHLKGKRESSGDIVLSWVRRARKNAAWVDYIDVPLDEAAALYDLEVVDADTANVVRTFENVESASVTYSAIEQASDWPSGVPESLRVNVYQKSARYGRGKKASVLV